MMGMETLDRSNVAWCTFRNLLHAVYREARHVGPPGDPDAKLVLSEGRYAMPQPSVACGAPS
jgi:hypothetical protein